jgi:large subunit ribosomal protein L7/L12
MAALSELRLQLTNTFSTSNPWSIISARRLATTTDAPPKPSKSTPPPVVHVADPIIKKIVDDISGLTLLQAADLVSLLKVRNIRLLVIKR